MSGESSIFEAEVSVLTLSEFVRISGWTIEAVHYLVEVGVLLPRGEDVSDWQFEAEMAALARRLRRLQDDLEVELDPAALALSYRLLERIQDLEVALVERRELS